MSLPRTTVEATIEQMFIPQQRHPRVTMGRMINLQQGRHMGLPLRVKGTIEQMIIPRQGRHVGLPLRQKN